MSGLDVEALLDSTAANTAPEADSDRHRSERSERRDRDHDRDGVGEAALLTCPSRA